MKEVDFLIAKSRTSPELFRYMLVSLFNLYGKSQIMGFDGIALYIGEKYYLKEATWADTTYIRKLKKQIVERTPTLIGKIAPDIDLISVPLEHFMNAAEDTAEKKNVYVGSTFNLHSVKNDFTILYFWDVDCGHCKKETPVMRDVYKKLKDKNVTLIAVSLVFSRESKEKWVNFVNENQLYDWINAFYPYSIKYKELYDIQSTPQLFILDKNKKIIAKRIGPEQCEEIINHEIEMNKKK
jgi:thiol-disulfide isomerase/thioredoxin